MTEKDKPTIVDLLYMPAAAEIEFEIEKVDKEVIKETRIDEFLKDLSDNDKLKSRP